MVFAPPVHVVKVRLSYSTHIYVYNIVQCCTPHENPNLFFHSLNFVGGGREGLLSWRLLLLIRTATFPSTAHAPFPHDNGCCCHRYRRRAPSREPAKLKLTCACVSRRRTGTPPPPPLHVPPANELICLGRSPRCETPTHFVFSRCLHSCSVAVAGVVGTYTLLPTLISFAREFW